MSNLVTVIVAIGVFSVALLFIGVINAPSVSGLLPPQNFIAKSIASDAILLSWTYSKPDNIKGFLIYRRINNGKWNLLTTIKNPYITSYLDLNIKSNTKYSYYIVTHKDVFLSKPSTILEVSIP